MNWPVIFHRACLVMWLAYAVAWAIGYLDWKLVLAYTVVVTVAWAETGNVEFDVSR